MQILNLTKRPEGYNYNTITGWSYYGPTGSRLDVMEVKITMNMGLPEQLTEWPSFISSKGDDLHPDTFELRVTNQQDEIKNMQEKYKRESLLLSDEQKVQREREIRAELNEYRILQNQNTQEYNKIRTELINDVRKNIVDFAQKIGKSQGYLLIIEKQSGTVLYTKDSLDITNQFVGEIDKQNNTEKK